MTSIRVLIAAGILVGGVLGMRYYAWQRQLGSGIKPGKTQQVQVTLWARPEIDDLKAVVPFQAWKIDCNLRVKGCETMAKLQAGDRLTVEGTWQALKDEPLRASRLKVERVKALKRWTSLPPTSVWFWIRQIETWRDKILNVYRSNLSEPYAGLLGGIVLGVKSDLPDQFYEALVKTGTVHIVAASGYNISLVVAALTLILVALISRKKAMVLTLLGIVLYVLLAGAAPSIIRAGLMGWVMVMAQTTGRLYNSKIALGIALGLMLFIWPWMIWSVSFMLSAAATIGIIYGSPIIQRGIVNIEYRISRTTKTKNKGLMSGELATTLAATLATLPIILIYFARISIIAPVINLLVLGLIPPVMVMGSALVLVGLIVPGLASLVAGLTYPLLWLFRLIVEKGASLPGAELSMAGGNWLFALGWWLMLALWWRVFNLRKSR